MGQAVSRAELQPGDLIFYYSPISHVAMYIGNGQMVHASTSSQPVMVVSFDSMSGFTTPAASPADPGSTPARAGDPVRGHRPSSSSAGRSRGERRQARRRSLRAHA